MDADGVGDGVILGDGGNGITFDGIGGGGGGYFIELLSLLISCSGTFLSTLDK